MTTPAYAAAEAKALLTPWTIDRRAPGPHEVQIVIRYCGVCHSDGPVSSAQCWRSSK